MFKMNVPVVAQAKQNTCWHASANMIWQYSQLQSGRQGPMDSLSTKWNNNNPIQPKEFSNLAEKVGLMSLHKVGDTYIGAMLEAMLKIWGPLWCAGHWFGPGHVVVLTGVESSKVFFNDPDLGKKKSGSLTWFNDKLASGLVGSIMAKNPKAY